MTDKQINELPILNAEDFEPGLDKFLVQRQSAYNKGTYSSTFANMITKGSAELPGTTDWEWNFLRHPRAIVGYQYGPTKKYDGSTGATQPFGSRTISFEADVTRDIFGNETGIPATAQNFLCVACVRNANLSFWAPRNKIVIAAPATKSNGLFDNAYLPGEGIGLNATLYRDSGFDGPIMETIFAAENISFPRDNKINISNGAQPQYREAGKLYFELTTRKSSAVGVTTWELR